MSSSPANTTHPSLHTGEVLIFDTGPLRELVLFHAVDQLRLRHLERELNVFVNRRTRTLDERTYSQCGQFISRFKTKTTSASVVAEIGRWIHQHPSMRKMELWTHVYYEFRNMGMDEQLVKLLDMEIDAVAQYGAADVSLLTLARRTPPGTSVILTVDGKLAGECQKFGIRPVLLSEFKL
jgi:hypothetical protein